MRRRLPLAAILSLACLVAAVWAGAPAPNAPVVVGSVVPKEMALTDINGKTHSLDEYRDRPVLVVVFISNHCPASQLYEGRIKAVVRDYGKDHGYDLALAAGAVVWQAVVGQHFQPNPGDALEVRVGHDRVGVALGSLAAGEEGAIG